MLALSVIGKPQILSAITAGIRASGDPGNMFQRPKDPADEEFLFKIDGTMGFDDEVDEKQSAEEQTPRKHGGQIWQTKIHLHAYTMQESVRYGLCGSTRQVV